MALLLGCVFSCESDKLANSQTQILEANLNPFSFSPLDKGLSKVIEASLVGNTVKTLLPPHENASTAPDNSGRTGIFYNIITEDGQVVRQAAAPNSAYTILDEALYDILQRYDIPGLAVAITKNGQTVFSRSYGYADQESGELVSEQSLFRIASLSKPITSAGILKLIQDGKIMLSDKVFGPEGVLGDDYPTPPTDSGIDQITIHDLLSHTSGWTSKGGDPMLSKKHLTAQQVIAEQVLNRELEYTPGSTFSYSNLGYSILGRVIEKVSGKSYADFIKEEILLPANANGMRIAGSTEEELAPKEVKYYQKEYDPYSYNMARMDAHGGWLATPADLMRFMNLIDRNQAIPDLITDNLLDATYFGTENWTHYGSLPGTTAVLTKLNNEYSFVVLANTRYNKAPNRIADELNDTLKERILLMEAWPQNEEPVTDLVADR